MARRVGTLLGWVAVLIGAVSGCEPAPSDDAGGSIVLVFATCTVNRNYIGAYGSSLGLTPNIDAFAEHGAVFDAHVTEAGYSGIAYASMFTSRYANAHGVCGHPGIISEGIYDLSEALRDQGYQVLYLGWHPMAAPELNYAQGANLTFRHSMQDEWGYFNAVVRANRERRDKLAVLMTCTLTHTPYNRGGLNRFDKTSDAFEALSRERVNEMLALFYADLYDLKFDYHNFVEEKELSPDDQRDLAVVVETLYRLNIRRLDSWFNRALNIVGNDAFVVFTADHGESLYDPDRQFQWSHSRSLAGDVLTVPFIIRGNGVRPQRVETVTRSIDVAPTIMGLLGAQAPPAEWTGVDLSDAMNGGTFPTLDAFSHSPGDPPLAALRRGDLVAWSKEGYTVRRVTDESQDIFNSENPEHVAMIEALKEWEDRIEEACAPGQSVRPDDYEDILRSLGYIE